MRRCYKASRARTRQNKKHEDGVLAAWADAMRAPANAPVVHGDKEKPELTRQYNEVEGYKTDLAEPHAGSLSHLHATAHDSRGEFFCHCECLGCPLGCLRRPRVCLSRIRRTYSAASAILPACTSEDL